MAKYKGRDYTIESYPTEEYSLILVDKNGNRETAKLSQVTLTKNEAGEFLKNEQRKIESKRISDEYDLALEEKRIADEKKAFELAHPEEVKRLAEEKKLADAKQAELDKNEAAKAQALAKVK